MDSFGCSTPQPPSRPPPSDSLEDTPRSSVIDPASISLKLIDEGDARRTSPRLQARSNSSETKSADESKRETKKNHRKRKDSDEDMMALMSKLSLDSNERETPSDSRTVLACDLDMTLHKNLFSSHPERPKRITEPLKLLKESRLLERLRTVPSRECTRDEALTVHSAEYWDTYLSALEGLGNRELYKLAAEHDSIYLNNHTFRAAKLAAGCTLAVAEEVLADRAMNGVAVVRPPGHHCRADRPMGFCILGNVPIACKVAVDKYKMERILVVDWDVHHGNGTQEMFYSDPNVLYLSLHRYDSGSFYPGTGHPGAVGDGPGAGFNVNIGWNQANKTDGDYLRTFYDIVLPVALEFQPQIVFISAGFDSGRGDPLGNCLVTPEGYGMMTHHLMSVCRGRVVLALEGGYNLTTVSSGIEACTSVLLGDMPYPIDPADSVPTQGTLDSIRETGKHLAPYWKSLKHFEEREDNKTVQNECVARGGIVEDGDRLMTLDEILKEGATDAPVTPPPESNLVPEPDNHVTSAESQVQSNPASAHIPPEDLTTEERLMADMAQSSNAKEPVKLEDTLFAVNPKLWCEHLADHVTPVSRELRAAPACSTCSDASESWYCITCYQPHCSRYVNEHGLYHALDSSHLLTLSMSDLSVWCYGCDSYIHNEALAEAKNAAQLAKFGVPANLANLTSIPE